jgi:predicted RNase H-like HicB family nuclease
MDLSGFCAPTTGANERKPTEDGINRILNIMQEKTMLTLTAVFEEQEDGSWIAWVEELPGANTQGDNFEDAKANLLEATNMILQAYREDAERELRGRNVIRERYCFA